jgi:hypothetical protein
MRGNGITENNMAAAMAWSVLLSLPVASAFILGGLLLAPGMMPFLLLASLAFLLAMRQYALGLLRAMMIEEGRRMAAEAPEVIGSLSIAIALNPSLEAAIRWRHDADGLRARLERSQWEVLLGKSPDLAAAISHAAMLMTEECRSLRQALYLVLGATRERTIAGRKRLLDKANALVIEGMRERVGRYASSLQLPTMAIFCLGIILPILLFTVIPMASMDLKGGEADQTMPLLSAALLLVVVPAITVVLVHGMVRRNPLRVSSQVHRPTELKERATLALLAAAGAGCALALMGIGSPLFPLLLCAPPCVMAFLLLRRKVAVEKVEASGEMEVGLLLFEVGNLLQSGSGPEDALENALSSRSAAPALERLRLCLSRHIAGLGPLASEVGSDEVLRRSAPMAREALLATLSACEKDPRAAGGMAIDLAQYLAELQRAKEGVRQQLRSLLDMMTFTATVFAPMVIGLTTSIFAAVAASGQMGGGLPHADLIGGIYVMELCLIAAYMGAYISGPANRAAWCWRCAISCPVAAIVLISASALSSSLTAL